MPQVRRAPALALVLLLGLASAAPAQGTYRDYLARQLAAIDQTVAGSGYQPVPAAIDSIAIEPFVVLESTSSLGLEVVLEAGQRYRIGSWFLGWEGVDCEKSLEDRLGNLLFSGEWSEDRLVNVLDFTAPASGTQILVFQCPEGVSHFFYYVERMSAAGSFQIDPDVFPRDMVVGFLKAGAAMQLGLELVPGVEYLIAGVCDQDCTDLDLALTDKRDAIILTDELDDDKPVLQFKSQADELYSIRVTMYACSIEPCSFAYRIYRR